MPQLKKKKRTGDVVAEPIIESRAMRELDRVLRAIAPKDVVISLVGESGTGKEILARRIHELSPRRAAPFIPINCAAIPDALFESELFGHEKGAFTGASERAFGKIEAADGGTLFLDEIGEMPLSVQAKLLRFLENRKFMRIGGNRKLSVDARLICATLRPLEEEVKAGRFRADLLYRIQGIPIRVPPLRERPADIAPLVRELTTQLTAKHETKPPRFGRATMAALRAYSWPGNVRELRNVVELACLLREGKSVRVRDLPPPLKDTVPSEAHASGVIEVSLDRSLDDIIESVLRAALELERGNRSKAARRLNVSLRTMQRFAARSSVRASKAH